ncbi:MAG: family 10 glycosylhydrolase [Myxococcota bacterium]
MSTSSSGGNRPDAGPPTCGPTCDLTARTCTSGAYGGCQDDPPQSIRLSPATLTLATGGTADLTVEVVLSSGEVVPVPLGAAFVATPQGILSVDSSGHVTAQGTGTAEVKAYVMGMQSNVCTVTVQGMAEARGLWVTRWDYTSVTNIEQILTNAQEAGFNQVYWQVRGRADAFYNSTLEPWGSELTGTLGGNPGFDPLQTAITKAHELGLELHAWVNTFPAWSAGTAIPDSTPPHPLKAHPEWQQVDTAGNPPSSGYLALSPGNVAVREHIQAVLTEISAYDIDGLHLDYIRYVGRDLSHDAASEAAYATAQQANPSLTYADFQRDAVADMVARARTALSTHHPDKPLSAAVWFVYENEWNWSSVSQGNIDFYQDTERWLAAGSVDVLIPMIYFPLTTPPGGRLDFLTLVDDHVARAAAHGRWVYAGFESDQELDEIEAEINVARTHGTHGTVAFAYSTLLQRGHLETLPQGVFAEPADVPQMPWLSP